jgi:SAM-dependent methyltransferase
MTNTNAEQAAHWNNSDEIGHWLTHQRRHDTMLAPFSTMLFDALQLTSGERVLDVGCGTGATTRAAAALVAPGAAVGVDISAPMLERSRADSADARLANVMFERADVQVHPFDDAVFDAVMSRFGIMFFDDPVAAFANLHRASRPGGRLAFVCWQPLTANEWLVVPGAALAEHVAIPPAAAPGAPGMFAFAEPDRVRQVLTDAGWRDITVTSQDTPMLVGGGGSIDDTVEFLRTGSLGCALLAGADAATTTRALDAVRDALVPYLSTDGARLDAAVWLVQAVA